MEKKPKKQFFKVKIKKTPNKILNLNMNITWNVPIEKLSELVSWLESLSRNNKS